MKTNVSVLSPSLRSRTVPVCASLCAALASLFSMESSVLAQNCPAPASWFPHSSTPPFDPNSFPGTSATDCDFHQWAWQTFLFITQDEGGRPRFLSYPTEAELFPSSPTEKPVEKTALSAK